MQDGALLLSITRVRVRRLRDVPRFAAGFRACIEQLRVHPQLLEALVRYEPSRVFWTASLWPSLAAMASYRNRNPHRTWMGHVEALCDESAYLRRSVTEARLVAWPRLVEEFQTHAQFTIMDPTGVSEDHRLHRVPESTGGLMRHVGRRSRQLSDPLQKG